MEPQAQGTGSKASVGSADGAASYRKATIARCRRALCGPTERSRRQCSGIDTAFEVAEPRSRTQSKPEFDSGATNKRAKAPKQAACL
jgi:hypothetical protein